MTDVEQPNLSGCPPVCKCDVCPQRMTKAQCTALCDAPGVVAIYRKGPDENNCRRTCKCEEKTIGYFCRAPGATDGPFTRSNCEARGPICLPPRPPVCQPACEITIPHPPGKG